MASLAASPIRFHDIDGLMDKFASRQFGLISILHGTKKSNERIERDYDLVRDEATKKFRKRHNHNFFYSMHGHLLTFLLQKPSFPGAHIASSNP
jgi:hypothetical protein